MLTAKQKRLLKKVTIRVEGEDDEYVVISVRVYDRSTRRWYWIDYEREGTDIVGDWNQYIFFTDNEDDNIRNERQQDIDTYVWMEDEGRMVLFALDFILYDDNGGDLWNMDKIREAQDYLEKRKKRLNKHK